ncbi:MAG: methyltransferase domain-containing protein, partial [Alphaproteobacteria bacterium]|nr:methyltransferase domain-containing protein [Alphaproteobacteria bacterium]
QALAETGDADAAADAGARADAAEADQVARVGASLLFHGDGLRAHACFDRALELHEACVSAHWLLGELFSRRGEIDRALHHYRRCLEIDPDANGPAYMIAALGGASAPDRAPDAYVAAFFDWYADHFDAHLTERLAYTGPRQVAEALATARPDGFGRVLDLGCGTGLAGEAVKPHSDYLVGVDLSPAMLEKARATGAYDELVEGELLDVLGSRADAEFDAVIAVDVLVYVGALDRLLAQVRRTLGADGVFIATFEDADADAAWELSASGRYRHASRYLRETGLAAGFAAVEVTPTTLREEYGEPVASLIAVFDARPA